MYTIGLAWMQRGPFSFDPTAAPPSRREQPAGSSSQKRPAHTQPHQNHGWRLPIAGSNGVCESARGPPDGLSGEILRDN